MKTNHATYTEARAEAQAWSDRTGLDMGLEVNQGLLSTREPYRIFFLPAPKHRGGYELRCEVVRPSDPKKWRY